MRPWLLSPLLLLVALTPASGDGLVYRLPPDGVGAVYEYESVYEYRGKKGKASGTLTVSSVGTRVVEKVPCRWIEVHLLARGDENPGRLVYKVLIPEKALQGQQRPFDHILQCWYAQRDGDPRELNKHPKDDRWGPLPVYLSGPLENAQPLDKAVVDSALGKLECTGLKGTITVDQETRKGRITVSNRFHDQAPFGLVASRMEFDLQRRQEALKGVETLKLIEVRKNIRSEWPDHK
jgi:hypothetical protein